MCDKDTMALELPKHGGDMDPIAICRLWYQLAFKQLELSDAMGKSQLHTVQVAAIMTLCNPHFGEGYRGLNLSSLANSTARALKMHLLGGESSYPASLHRIPEWSTQPQRELGRRLWWTLVICDW